MGHEIFDISKDDLRKVIPAKPIVEKDRFKCIFVVGKLTFADVKERVLTDKNLTLPYDKSTFVEWKITPDCQELHIHDVEEEIYEFIFSVENDDESHMIVNDALVYKTMDGLSLS